MLCWGKADCGALGVGGVDELTLPTPTWNKALSDKHVSVVACGHAHSLFLLDNGSVFSCGSNEFGQLGQDISSTRPSVIQALQSMQMVVVDVKCGRTHSVALTSNGHLYSWGNNHMGQLGVLAADLGPHSIPREVRLHHHIVQVACGGEHNLALTQFGYVFSWGSNSHGQLGHGSATPSTTLPMKVPALIGIPVARLAAGSGHSMAVSVTGMVLGWGFNNFGQVGIGTTSDVLSPIELKALRSQGVKFVACGDEHTALLTQDGGVFTFGSNNYGQLGHCSTISCYPNPTKVLELMGSEVSQIACGRNHSMALVKSSGKVFSFGQGTSGQLGTGALKNSSVPIVASGNWLPPSMLDDCSSGTPVDPGNAVKRIFTGGNCSFASVTSPAMAVPFAAVDYRLTPSSETPLFLSYELTKQMLDVALITNSVGETMRTLEAFFKSPSCVTGSFLLKNRLMEDPARHSNMNQHEVSRVFSHIHERLALYEAKDRLFRAIQYLLASFPDSPTTIECLRVFVLVLCHPSIYSFPQSVDLLGPFCQAFLKLTSSSKDVLATWLFDTDNVDFLTKLLLAVKYPIAQLLLRGKAEAEKAREDAERRTRARGERIVHQQNEHLVRITPNEMSVLEKGLLFMQWIHKSNTSREEALSHELFYIPDMIECVNLVQDYFNYITNDVSRIVFLRFPFLMNAVAKSRYIEVDMKVQMGKAVAFAHHRNLQEMFTGQVITDFSPDACVLRVRRTNLVQDALVQLLQQNPRNYKKPLQVVFDGEEGLDFKGVKKEFFMLLFREILNPDFGMFYEDDESHFIWFRDQSLLLDEWSRQYQYFQLIGVLCGMVIYNAVIVNLPFPTALYKKLLKRKVGLTDLEELKPSVGKHMKALLEDKEQNFCSTYPDLRFEINRHFYGTNITKPLVPNGTEILVTTENRNQYVQAYIDYELTDSVRDPYLAFEEGFHKVCTGEIFGMLHPKELMSMVIGLNLSSVDFSDLETHMRYENGYTADHPTIRLFWSIFASFTLEAKRKLLLFWTGCDRIPLSGIKSMRMRIQRMDGGIDFNLLPVAHTCFNVLDLPPYPTEELMRDKLLKAMNFSQGFGIV